MKTPSIRQWKSSEADSGAKTAEPKFIFSTPFGRSLVKRVQNDDATHTSLPFGSSILIACSGGADSVALLHILLSLREKLGLRLGVVHMNYRLRGKDSDHDEKLVHDFCTRYGLPIFLSRPKDATGKNEEHLRDIRYRYFERIRAREHFDRIATAHNEDDQAETVLIRLLRGTGPDGLAAMRPINGRIIRPLLRIPKSSLTELLAKEHIPFREDVTNRDVSILRNRIRHNLLPLLDKEYRPGIRSVLARTATLFQGETSVADSPSFHLRTEPVDLGVSFFRTEYLSLADSERAHELRRLYRIVSISVKFPSQSFVHEVDKLIRSSKGKIRSYASVRLKIVARGDKVTMIRNQ